MKKYILLLFLLIVPVMAFGQSFEGDYKAQFAASGNSEKTEVEFQVQAGGAVVGRLKFGEVVKAIKGQVDYNGNLEAASERAGNAIYTLKADMSRSDGKITLFSRFEEKVGSRQSFSQSMMQGKYSRIEKPVVEESDKVSGKNELLIEYAQPLFAKEFSGASAQITPVKEDFLNVYNFQMIFDDAGKSREFYFTIAKVPASPQNVWKLENIRFIRYLERIDNYTKTNNFYSDYETWRKNRETTGGQIELLTSNARQMVFKITNLKIKSVAGNETVTINGTVYADIQ
ncbi:MAG: hypothetical protein ABWZ66_10785, partial [Pyrinomonadaceae bacterium]